MDSVLPKSLSMAFNIFQKQTSTIQKIQPSKAISGASDTIEFRLPTSQVLDTDSLAIVAKLKIVVGTSNVLFNGTNDNTLQLGKLINRIDVLSGNQEIVSYVDHHLSYNANKKLSEPRPMADYEVATYREFSTGTTEMTPATYYVPLLLDDLPAIFKSMRFVPLAAMNQLTFRVQFNTAYISAKLIGSATCTITFDDVYMLSRLYSFSDNLVDSIVARQLSSGAPLQIICETRDVIPHTSTATGTFTLTATVAKANVDTVVLYNRKSSASPYVGEYFKSISDANATNVSTDGGNTAQLFVNGQPVSSHALTNIDAYYANQDASDSLSGNILGAHVDVKLGWLTENYFPAWRFNLPTVDKFEDNHSALGMSTHGSLVPMQLQFTGTINDTVQPYLVVFGKRYLELSAGRQINVVV